MTQTVFYSAVTHVLTEGSKSAYSQHAGTALDDYFISSPLGMHPNMNFGQIVRGPGQKGQQGTFTGILDLRGIVRIINGVLVLRAAGGDAWSKPRDDGFRAWTLSYVNWLQSNSAAKQAAASPKSVVSTRTLCSAQVLIVIIAIMEHSS